MRNTTGGCELDEVDYKLIEELSKDGRLKLCELSQKVGLKHPSVRERINRLVKSGVVKIQANVSLRKLGFRAAFISMEMENAEKAVEAAKKLSCCPRVLLLGIGSGAYNLFIVLVGSSFNTLYAIVEKQIRALPGVRRIAVSYGELLCPEYAPLSVTKNSLPCESEGGRGGIVEAIRACSKCPLPT